MGGDRQFCEIRGWKVFTSGTHKETAEFFSSADTKKFEANYRRFGHIPVTGKLGHERIQRFRKSLGLPAAVGRLAAMHTDPNGDVVFDRVVGIPRIVGSAIVSGFLPGVSIELAPRPAAPGRRIIRDPADPSAPIDGDILTGWAFLGEELPAVPGYKTPKPVFADGTPVPPLTDEEVRWWLEKMAPFLTPAGSPGSKDDEQDEADSYTPRHVAFSALTFDPVRNPMEQQLAALGLTPEQIQGVLALVPADAGAAPTAPAPPAPPVEDHPAFKAMSAEMADLKKNFGAIAEKLTAGEKEKDEACMSAMSARVDSAIKEKNLAQKVAPVALPAVRDQLLGILTSKTFAAGSDRDAAFGSALDVYAALPVNPMLRDAAADTRPAGSALAGQTQHGRKVIAALEAVAPNVHKRLTAK